MSYVYYSSSCSLRFFWEKRIFISPFFELVPFILRKHLTYTKAEVQLSVFRSGIVQQFRQPSSWILGTLYPGSISRLLVWALRLLISYWSSVSSGVLVSTVCYHSVNALYSSAVMGWNIRPKGGPVPWDSNLIPATKVSLINRSNHRISYSTHGIADLIEYNCHLVSGYLVCYEIWHSCPYGI
jgi:hypothetical protein